VALFAATVFFPKVFAQENHFFYSKIQLEQTSEHVKAAAFVLQ
jgi:hypothetical protein